MIQSQGFLNFLRPLTKIVLPFSKNSANPSIKNVLLPLGLTTPASAADAGIHKKILGPGHNRNLIISNDEMEDILKIVRSLENSGLLLERVSETIKNKAKKQKGGFLSALLGTLRASLFGNMLAGKVVVRAGKEQLQLAVNLKDLHSKKKKKFHHILSQALKYKCIIRMNLDSTEFILEIICLIK